MTHHKDQQAALVPRTGEVSEKVEGPARTPKSTLNRGRKTIKTHPSKPSLPKELG